MKKGMQVLAGGTPCRNGVMCYTWNCRFEHGNAYWMNAANTMQRSLQCPMTDKEFRNLTSILRERVKEAVIVG